MQSVNNAVALSATFSARQSALVTECGGQVAEHQCFFAALGKETAEEDLGLGEAEATDQHGGQINASLLAGRIERQGVAQRGLCLVGPI